MPKYKVMIARFPYGGQEEAETVDWLIATAMKIDRDPRFDLVVYRVNDTPITMTRNHVIDHAKKHGVDLLLMVDSDMAPDIELGADPAAKPFWETAVEFVLNHPGPCVVAAPYCGPPPVENVYVFTWADAATADPNPNGRLTQYTREQAAVMSGVQEVAALPTGLILFDMRAFNRLEPPYTYYEWEDDGPKCGACGEPKAGKQMEKASTEDVTLTRDLSLAGVKQYCAWDSWAGHVKRKVVRKPQRYTVDAVASKLRPAILRRDEAGDRLIAVAPAAGSVEAIKAACAARAAARPERTEGVVALPPAVAPPPAVEAAPAVAPPPAAELDAVYRRYLRELARPQPLPFHQLELPLQTLPTGQ